MKIPVRIDYCEKIDFLSELISNAYFIAGIGKPKEEDLTLMVAMFAEQMSKKQFNILQPFELRRAITQGAYGEYGGYYGINPHTLLDWVKAYMTSDERQLYLAAIKIRMQKKPLIALAENNPMNPEQRVMSARSALEKAYEGYINDVTMYSASWRIINKWLEIIGVEADAKTLFLERRTQGSTNLFN